MVHITSIADLGKHKLLSEFVFFPTCNKRNAYAFVSGDGIAAKIRLRTAEDEGVIQNPEIVPFQPYNPDVANDTANPEKKAYQDMLEVHLAETNCNAMLKRHYATVAQKKLDESKPKFDIS